VKQVIRPSDTTTLQRPFATREAMIEKQLAKKNKTLFADNSKKTPKRRTFAR
jgi:hypothetical protein